MARIEELEEKKKIRQEYLERKEKEKMEKEIMGMDSEINIDDKSIEIATQYIEAAYRNGIDPKVFANSARSSIPGPILEYVRGKGIDSFLDNVAKLDGSSALTTVAGREYVRNVAKCLLGQV